MSYTYRPKPTRVVLPMGMTPAELAEAREDAREAARLGRSVEWIAKRMALDESVVRTLLGESSEPSARSIPSG